MENIYPQPEEHLGAPFTDPNLKLVVLGSLLRDKYIDLGTPQEFASWVYGRDVDLEAEGYELLDKCYDYLVRYPLTPALLKKVTFLEFDGSCPLYPYAHYFFEGDGDAFDVQSFEGLGHCPNIKEISVISMVYGADLQDLVGLQKLEELSLSGEEINMSALQNIPSLKKVSGFFGSTEGDDLETIEILKKRGVTVKSFN